MKTIDTSVFVASADRRIKPEAVDLGDLPPIQKPNPRPAKLIYHQSPDEQPISSEAKWLPATRQPDNQATNPGYMRSVLESRSLKPLTLRFPPELWEKLDEVLYYIKRRFKRKLTKNEVIMLSVALLLKDFDERDLESELYQLLVVKRG